MVTYVLFVSRCVGRGLFAPFDGQSLVVVVGPTAGRDVLRLAAVLREIEDRDYRWRLYLRVAPLLTNCY